MSYLYEHRDQLDGLKHFAEIAYHATYGTRPPDRDDLEQDIIITMMCVVAKKGKVDEGYLWGIARMQIKRYWTKVGEEVKRSCPLYEDSGDDDNDGQEMDISDNIDIDSRLDAIAILATLPKRLVEIGYKRLNGEKLSSADREYWNKTKKKVAYNGSGCHLSNDDKERIRRLWKKGYSPYKIRKVMGRNSTTIREFLQKEGLRDKEEMPPSLQEYRNNRRLSIDSPSHQTGHDVESRPPVTAASV